MAEKKMICAACGKEKEGDFRVEYSECRICHRMHCDGCINKEGICVSCEQKLGSGLFS